MTDAPTNPTPDEPAPVPGADAGAVEAGAPPAVPPAVRWTMTILALGALVGSVVLTWQSMGQSLLPGCEPGSRTGCDTVLTSEWARWFGVPVAAPAALLYAAMFTATFFIGPGRSAAQHRWAWTVLWIGAVTALGAALWFGALQGLVIGAFCRYCTAVHATAGVLAVLVFFTGPRVQHANHPLNPAPLTLLGLVLVAVLGFGQVAQPQPEPAMVEASFLGGNLNLSASEVPVLGSSDADVWLVYLFDYTCRFCRDMHPQLDAALERYEGRLGIIPLPVPLNADCNPAVGRTPPTAEDACDLALLALAVWRADPDQFAGFDHWLFASEDGAPSAEEARARAIELVGEEALEEALDSGWPSEHLANSTSVYMRVAELTDRRSVPIMMVGDVWFPVTRDAEALFYVLETASPLEPPAETP